jgi:ectoine hydroxylase-related dioxygenase (phytanoyl-CoA dioxygenase family)
MQTNALGAAHCTEDEITDSAAQLFDDEPSALSASGVIFRMDAPLDTRNALDWHQDQSYMPVNANGLHGLVVWIPLQDVTQKTGAIRVRVGSHRQGHVGVALAGGDRSGFSEQYAIGSDLSHPEEIVEMRAGSALFFPMTLVHASGQNQGNRIRFTLGIRFHRALAEDFEPFCFDRVFARRKS